MSLRQFIAGQTIWALALGLAACSSAPPAPVYGPETPSSLTPAQGTGPVQTQTSLADVGLDAGAMDRGVSACEDFYSYACGGWIKATEIPGDKSQWVRSFSEIQKRNEETLRTILDSAAKASPGDAMTKRLGGYYKACMDEPAIEANGLRPILELVGKAKKVRDAKAVASLVTELHKRRIWALFDLSAAQDFKDATKVIATLDQNGLGLPDRDQYLEQDEKSKETRAFYANHVERMMGLVGLSPQAAKSAADDVMKVETEIAKVSKTRVERRDPKGLYNKIDRTGLAKTTPRFPWDDYFAALGIASAKDVNVTSVPFFEGVNALLKSIPSRAWQSYLMWRIVDSSASLLPKVFVDESFAMQAFLTGQKDQPVRWKRCVTATDSAMGELLAQPFIATSFAGESKVAAERMVGEIGKAFAREVEQLDWMDATTKARATEKLKSMAYLIGYPDKWEVYDFPIDPTSYADNVLAARVWETKHDLAKIGKPLNREEWQMSPPTVNAYYDPQRNHMVFPAGILQPPFYSVKAAPQVNLGGMGMVVGHELTHGFDDEGSQFDGEGNLADWWDPAVGERFKAKTSCVADQYGAYEALPGLKLNGSLTLGENIADLGGLKLAFAAYRAMRAGAAEVLVAEGLSEDQQFFLAHAQAWCGKRHDELTRLLVTVDPHSPPRFRVNGPLSNMPEFASAYGCAEGTPMHPAKTCAVW